MSSFDATSRSRGRRPLFHRDRGSPWWFIAMAVLLLQWSVPSSGEPNQCLVPWEWRLPPSVVDRREGPLGNYLWLRDRNGNRVDDFLEDLERLQFELRKSKGAEADVEHIDLIIALNTCQPEQVIRRMLEEWDARPRSIYIARYVPLIVLEAVTPYVDLLARIARDHRVAMIEWAEPMRPMLAKAMQTIRWNPAPSPYTKGMSVAVIDTAVAGQPTNRAAVRSGNASVPTAEGCLANTWVKESLDAMSENSPWVPGPICPCNDSDCAHGTAVAAILAGHMDSSKSRHPGVSPGTSIMSLRACTASDCDVPAIFRSLEAVLDRRKDISLVNMSVAGCIDDDGRSSYAQMVDRVAASGIPVVVALGNARGCSVDQGQRLVPRPASASLAIVVSGVDDRGARPMPFDQNLRGPRCDGLRPDIANELSRKPDIIAPAKEIALGDSNVQLDGVSFAAPFVTGVIAGSVNHRSGAPSVCAIKCAIKESSRRTLPDHSAGKWHDEYGHGLLDGAALLQSLQLGQACKPSKACEERVRMVLQQSPPSRDDLEASSCR